MKTITLSEEQISIIDDALNYYGEDIRMQIDDIESYGGDLDDISELEETLEQIDNIQKSL
jgi:hypothetical protein